MFCVSDAAFLRVLPNRLQFFEYEFISFNCEFGGSAEWRVMRTLQEITPTNISNWETSAGSGTITPAFSSDSGEYWCEDGDGRRSNALNISVTGRFSWYLKIYSSVFKDLIKFRNLNNKHSICEPHSHRFGPVQPP